MTNIDIQRNIFLWDIEMWQSYVRAYESNEIQGGTAEDYQRCLMELNAAKHDYERFMRENAEEFI